MPMLSQSSISPSLPRSNKNQSIEVCKLIASFFVVFAHVPFPGVLGMSADCLAKFTVAFFFAVTGYFNYQITDAVKIKSRILHILKLNIIASFAEIIWKLIETEYHNGSSIAYLRSIFPSAYNIRLLLILNINLCRVHLWYLFAILEIYIILSIYVRFQGKRKINYQPLYIVSICLLAINIVFSVYGLSVEFIVNPWLFYNAIFYGLPMFSFGIFVHEYQDRIMENFSITTPKLLILLIAGISLAFIETLGSSGHYSYIYIGSMTQMVAILLLCLHHPRIASQSKAGNFIISKLGLYSTTIYIVHYIMFDAYTLFFQVFISAHFGPLGEYLRPIIVVAMSLVAAILCDLTSYLVRAAKKS